MSTSFSNADDAGPSSVAPGDAFAPVARMTSVSREELGELRGEIEGVRGLILSQERRLLERKEELRRTIEMVSEEGRRLPSDAWLILPCV
jgi:hypothetical protein